MVSMTIMPELSCTHIVRIAIVSIAIVGTAMGSMTMTIMPELACTHAMRVVVEASITPYDWRNIAPVVRVRSRVRVRVRVREHHAVRLAQHRACS